MLRKLLVAILIGIYAVSSLGIASAAAQEMTMLDKVNAVEMMFYGTNQTGAVIDRINQLEKDIYGANSKAALASKADKLYSDMKDSSLQAPSYLVKLNAAEWALTHNVTNLPAKTRLENIEKVLMGNSSEGSFAGRVEKLLKLTYTNGQVNLGTATLSKDSLIKIKLVSPLSTKTNRAGDDVSFQAAEDVYVNGLLVIAKGATGTGKIAKVEQARNFGRDAQMTINFDSIEAVDGTSISTVLGEKAKEENKSLATAAGASIAGMAILGPVGIVGGAFVNGKNIDIPAGTELYIQNKADLDILGLQTK